MKLKDEYITKMTEKVAADEGKIEELHKKLETTSTAAARFEAKVDAMQAQLN